MLSLKHSLVIILGGLVIEFAVIGGQENINVFPKPASQIVFDLRIRTQSFLCWLILRRCTKQISRKVHDGITATNLIFQNISKLPIIWRQIRLLSRKHSAIKQSFFDDLSITSQVLSSSTYEHGFGGSLAQG